MADAKAAFLKLAKDLDRIGQQVEASLHIGASADTLNEYPDFILYFDGETVHMEVA